MILLYIEDKILSGTIATYLDYLNLDYTTNIDHKVECAIVAEINPKTRKIAQTTKTIFIAYLEEQKIYTKFMRKNKVSKQYKEKILKFFEDCTNIVVSMPIFQKIISTSTNITVIPKEPFQLNLVKTKKGKDIVFYDPKYQNLNMIYELSIHYPKLKFYYVGYKNELTMRERTTFNKLPNNVIKYKKMDIISYMNLVNSAYIVIHNDIDDFYQIPILLKKNLIIKDIPYYENFLIPSKDCYFYDNFKSLVLKLEKIKNRRLSNLTDEVYCKLSKIDCKYVSHKYQILLV